MGDGSSEDCYLTVGELKKRIKKLPNDAKVYYQRVEDHYFKDGTGWKKKSVFKPSDEPEFLDEYIKVWGIVEYKNDKNLYLTAFY